MGSTVITRKFLAALAFCVASVTLAGAQTGPAPVPVSITVDTDRPGAEISKYIYGQFAEHLGTGIYGGIWVGANSPIPNINGYRRDVVEALKAIKVPTIRWPGGCFADTYEWRDGIGPRDRRPVRINVNWGGVHEDNSFGTHEFMNFMELLGADANIALNVGSSTPYSQAQWLEYMTSGSQSSLAQERRRNGRDKPWNVRFIGIGNETWGCGGNMTAEYSASINRRYATFLNTPREMRTQKIASGSRNEDYDFAETIMRDGGRFDGLSVHYYTVPRVFRDKGPATGFPETEWTSTLRNALRIEQIVTRTAQIMDKYDPSGRVGLYVDEWGTWYDPAPGSNPGFLVQQNTLRDALVAGLSLNVFQRNAQRVKGANIAQMINVLQAMIMTDGPHMVLTPTYHVFDLYQVFMGSRSLRTLVSSPDSAEGLPMVDVSAARGADGKLYLSLVNTDPHKAARVSTNLAGQAQGRIVTAAAMDAHNSFGAPNSLRPGPFRASPGADGKLVVDLPAKSVVVLAVE